MKKEKITFSTNGHVWVFVFDPNDAAAMIDVARQYAENEEEPFCWFTEAEFGIVKAAMMLCAEE